MTSAHPPVKVLPGTPLVRVIHSEQKDCFMTLLRGLFCAD